MLRVVEDKLGKKIIGVSGEREGNEGGGVERETC